jgi:hypothetical protein
VLKKKPQNVSHNESPKKYKPKVIGCCIRALSSLCISSMLIKQKHIIICYNQIFQTTFEVKILPQYFYDILPSVSKNIITRTVKPGTVDRLQAMMWYEMNYHLW